jgi:SP family arabinose:H+ symporter-like MFS transporter
MDALRQVAVSDARSGSGAYLALVAVATALAGLLFGFDTAVISGTVERVQAQYGLDAVAVGLFTSSALGGCIAGAAVAGWLGDRFGRRPNLFLAGILFLVSAIFSMLPPSYSGLIVARVVGGVGVGIASVLAPTYLSELAPPRSRGRLVAGYQLSIVIGILVAYLSNWAILQASAAAQASGPTAGWLDGWLRLVVADEPWRGMFGAEILPAGLFLALLLLVPESPRWLIETGRLDRGREILARIVGPERAATETDEIARATAAETGTLAELFAPGLRRALLVGVMLSVFGQLSGVNIVVYYGPKILAAAGFAETAALLGQVGFGLINLVFTILALSLIDSLGRRPLLVGGMAVVAATLAVIGVLFQGVGPLADVAAAAGTGGELAAGTAAAIAPARGLAIGVAICVYMAAIAFSICAVIWVLTPEIFPNRVRARAVSICTLANWATNFLGAFAFPWVVERFGMAAAFLAAAGICGLATAFFFTTVPETKGRSLEAIEAGWR